MTRRIKLIGATVFNLINLGGAIFAVAMGEPLHAFVHVVLLAAGAYFMWRLAPSGDQQELPGARQAAVSLDHLQQSVDAIALEVERISEAQRFEAKLLNERIEKSALKKDR